MRMRLLGLAATAALLFSQTGCLKAILTNGQISATRNAAGALDTVGDFEMARSSVAAGLAQFEGMHRLAPDNTDALYLLTKGWAGYGFAIAEDDMEAAVDKGDDEMAAYHKKRARMAYERAVFYGLELLRHEDDGFEKSRRNEETFKKWLDSNFDDKEDAENLFWVGYAWLGRVNIAKDEPALVGDLFIGVTMLEKSVQLNPEYNHYAGTTALAAYHARTAMSEMDQSQKMFEEAIAKTNRKALVIQLNYATRWACNKGDKALYEKLINEVLTADDPDPQQRFTNTLAKRRARRALLKSRMEDCGF
jgi:tetratricopeptide (TPR) repeat protein